MSKKGNFYTIELKKKYDNQAFRRIQGSADFPEDRRTYKKFKSKEDAEKWLSSGANYDIKITPKLKDGIYFDAGTGRGIGVEVKITDKNGHNLISKVVPKEKINPYGNFTTKEGSTNNLFDHVTIKNGTIAIRSDLNDGDLTTTLNNTQLYNHSVNALLAIGGNIEANNLVASNCGQATVALSHAHTNLGYQSRLHLSDGSV